MPPLIGTAGWSITAAERDRFPGEGTALQRYAARLRGVEVNSSFHRPHRRSTWERWAASVPGDFRFAAKLPKEISHVRKLVDCAEPLAAFLDQAAGLGDKLAILLLQLPPKLAFDHAVAEPFLRELTERAPARIVCEPRHPSWFDAPADGLLDALGIARAGADPAPVESAAAPGGWRGLTYLRLHGSPAMYRSAYGEHRLRAYAARLALPDDRPAWCMFDNTAASHALSDAMMLAEMLRDARC